MKRMLAFIVCLGLVLSGSIVCSAEENQYTVENGFISGSIVIDGITFYLDALFDDNMAMPLREVLVVPPAITVNAVQQKLQEHFALASSFELADSRAGWFQFASVDRYYSAGLPSEANYHKLTPTIVDEGLNKAVEQCKSFLDALGVEYYPVPTYAVYGDIQKDDAETWKSTMERTDMPMPYEIRFANVVDGMAIDPMAAGGKRDPQSIQSDRIMTDNAYTTFTFLETGELAELFLYTFEVADSVPVEGSVIPWKDAVRTWYDIHKEANALKYFEGSNLYVTRIQAVWLTTYNNILRPGWYIEIQGRDIETGMTRINNDGFAQYAWLGVDAITGGWE